MFLLEILKTMFYKSSTCKEKLSEQFFYSHQNVLINLKMSNYENVIMHIKERERE